MADKQDGGLRMTVEPLPDTAQRALRDLDPCLAIRWQDGGQRFLRRDAVFIHCLANGSSLETAEMTFDQVGVDQDRLARCRGNNLGGLHRADQRATDDGIERDTLQPPGRRARLRDALVIQGNIGAALKPSLPVPVGDAMAKTKKGTRRRRDLPHFDLLVNFFTAARNSSVCMQSMIFASSASSCCLVGVTAAW